MELWKSAEGKWIKEKFVSASSGPIENCFSLSVSLGDLILEELRCRHKSRRWIVFSEEEQAELHRLGERLALASGMPACRLLDMVVHQIRENYGASFGATYISEDTSVHPLSEGANHRLVIQIEE